MLLVLPVEAIEERMHLGRDKSQNQNMFDFTELSRLISYRGRRVLSYVCSVFIASALLTGCENRFVLTDYKTANVSSIAMASGYCSKERKIQVTDISIDGLVVVGKCAKISDPNEWQRFSYSKASGFEILDVLVGKPIDELKISGDGRVIWGSYYEKGEGGRIFRYAKSVGVQHFDTLSKPLILIGGVSADGAVIVGSYLTSLTGYPVFYRAYKYSLSEGFEDLGFFDSRSTHPHGVSADGSIVVGHVDFFTNINKSVMAMNAHAFSYSKMNGMRDIASLRSSHDAFATGVSDDGDVVAGLGRFTIGFIVPFYEDSYGFVRLRNGTMQKIHGINGVPTVIRVSSDGTRVAGSYIDSKRDRYVFTAGLTPH